MFTKEILMLQFAIVAIFVALNMEAMAQSNPRREAEAATIDQQRNRGKKGEKVDRLTVSDEGIGIAETTVIGKSKSLGLKLVASLTEQLGGQLELCRNGGTKFTLTFQKQ